MNGSVNPGEPSARWRTFGYVLLFWSGYALLLIGSGMLWGMLPWHWQQILLPPWQLMVFGPVMSLEAMILTVLLVRREKISLEDVGVAFRQRSPVGFMVGFLIGLVLVALNLGIVSLTTGMRLRWAPRGQLGRDPDYIGQFLRGRLRRRIGIPRISSPKIGTGVWVVGRAGHGCRGFRHLSSLGGRALDERFCFHRCGIAAFWHGGDRFPGTCPAHWLACGLGVWRVDDGWKGILEDGVPGGAFLRRGISISYLAVAGLGILAFWLWHQRNLR